MVFFAPLVTNVGSVPCEKRPFDLAQFQINDLAGKSKGLCSQGSWVGVFCFVLLDGTETTRLCVVGNTDLFHFGTPKG